MSFSFVVPRFFLLSLGVLLFTSPCYPQGGVEVITDTEMVDAEWKATIRASYTVPDIEGLSTYQVVNANTGAAIPTPHVVEGSIWIPKDMPDTEAQAWIGKATAALKASNPKAVVNVFPIFEGSEQQEQRESNVQPDGDGKPQLDPRSRTLFQWVALGFKERINTRKFQMYLVGALVTFGKMSVSYAAWAAAGVDPVSFRQAIGAAWPQDIAWGLFSPFMTKIMNEWPRILSGNRVSVPPATAGFIYGSVVAVANAIWFRSVMHQAQTINPSLITKPEDRVDSPYSQEFVIDLAYSQLPGWFLGGLYGTTARRAMLRGQISPVAETLFYQVMGFEMQAQGLILAAFPGLVKPYAVVSNLFKLTLWGFSHLLSAKKGRVHIIHPGISERMKKDIYYRLGLPTGDPTLFLEIPTEAFDASHVARVFKNGSVLTAQLPQTPEPAALPSTPSHENLPGIRPSGEILDVSTEPKQVWYARWIDNVKCALGFSS